MDQKKIEYLKKHIGFNMKDLRPDRELELLSIKDSMNLADEWIFAALSRNNKDNWNEWGFGTFKNANFQKKVSDYLAIIEKADIERLTQSAINDNNIHHFYWTKDKIKKEWGDNIELLSPAKEKETYYIQAGMQFYVYHITPEAAAAI